MRFVLLRRHRSWSPILLWALIVIAASLSAGIRAARADGDPIVRVAQVEDERVGEESAPAAAESEGPGESQPEDSPPESGDLPPGVEEIRVRGRATEAIETDVPSSLTVFDASALEALGAQDISDLSRVTPNVNIVQPGSTQATFFVRGVGLSDFSSNAAGAVTIFQDDVALNAAPIQTGQIYDVEGVEILRGPQGSGPFRNASGGAIRVRSRRPTGNYNATLRSSLGWYDTKGDKGAKKALVQDYEGALEMPIVEESLSSRFAFRLRDADPYKTNGCGDALPLDQRLRLKDPFNPGGGGFPINTPGVIQCGERSTEAIPAGQISTIPFGLPKHVNDEHNWAARGTFGFKPPDTEAEFVLNAHGSRLDQDSTLGQAIGTTPLPGGNTTPQIRFAGRTPTGYVDADVQEEFDELCRDTNPGPGVSCANPFVQHTLTKRLAEDRPLDKRPYRGDYNRVGQTTRDTWGAFVSGEGEVFADTKLFGLVSYDAYERFQDIDSDFTPEIFFETVQSDEAWQTYNELQLKGELEVEPVEWSLGGYYLREDLDNDGTVFTTQDPLFQNLNIQRIYSQTIDSAAFWGEFAWDFADVFTLEGGVRYNWERKRFDFTKIGGNFQGSTVRSREEETWQTPTGQIILTYHFNADTSAYARYTRGFKAGHFNALAGETGVEAVNGTFDVEPADEEYNDSWEAGLRGAWLDRRLSLAGSFFYYRYENYQIFLFTDSSIPNDPPVLEIVNAPQAENYGVELEGTLRPLDGWAPQLVSDLELSANFSWLHGEYLKFTAFRKFTGGNPIRTFNASIDYSGNQLQNSPEYKVSATAEWSFDLGRFGYIVPRYDVNWSDDVFFDPNEGRGSIDPTGGPALLEYGVGQKQYFLHNVRLAYRTPSRNIEVAGWVRNVEDQVYKNYAFDVSRFTGLVINYPGEPRTIGMDISFTF